MVKIALLGVDGAKLEVTAALVGPPGGGWWSGPWWSMSSAQGGAVKREACHNAGRNHIEETPAYPTHGHTNGALVGTCPPNAHSIEDDGGNPNIGALAKIRAEHTFHKCVSAGVV